jgi:hypothetical protein
MTDLSKLDTFTPSGVPRAGLDALVRPSLTISAIAAPISPGQRSRSTTVCVSQARQSIVDFAIVDFAIVDFAIVDLQSSI